MRTESLPSFTWPVATGGYCWIDTKWGKALAEHPDQPGPPRRYRPFDRRNAGLFSEFAALKPTQESILEFADQYGLLGTPVTGWGKDLPLLINSPEVATFASRPEIRERLGAMMAPFECFDTGPDPDRDHCWTRQIAHMADTLKLKGQKFRGPDHERPDVARLTRHFHATVLKIEVNKILHQTCGPTLTWPGGRRPQFGLNWMPQSLLGALWLQAAMSLTGEKKFQRCANANCVRMIEISLDTGFREGTMFCSDACKMQDYRTRRRKARLLAKRGWTPARIAKNIGRETKIVRGWLKAKK